ncbi:guanylyl cyclase [Cardiosporidium cionae]|uniref:Guanylyl cyclase n=1 Tax=Cardiosporidium cionae TaxID=476202 RepID=A0ABQ7JCN5_9APIC|nr:guanylyl cyclase [Cardiosporidium cionae]|eukprot:KAF8821741.1 guanylyl cyclase [Cardiosporidium cionae]
MKKQSELEDQSAATSRMSRRNIFNKARQNSGLIYGAISRADNEATHSKMKEVLARHQLNQAAKRRGRQRKSTVSLIDIAGSKFQVRTSVAERQSLLENKQKLYKETQQKSPWDTRKLVINPTDQNDVNRFPINQISTTRYGVFTFLPKNIWEQFHRLPTVIYLVIAIIQLIPTNNRTQNVAGVFSLGCVMLMCAIRDIIEDYCRYLDDYKVNMRYCNKIDGSSPILKTTRWGEIKVGNILFISNGEEFPADVVILSSSNSDSRAYVDTSSLNGELVLKPKQSVKETKGEITIAAVAAIRGRIECEKPHSSLDLFQGTLKLEAHPRGALLNISSFIHKGSILRITNWIFAVVIYTGKETRINQSNKIKISKKTGWIDSATNFIVFLMAALAILAFLISSIVSVAIKRNTNDSIFWAFLKNSNFLDSATQFVWLDYFVLYGSLIPFSYLLSIDLIKILQPFNIVNDKHLMSEKGFLQPKDRNANAHEKMGCVDIVVADKTGTITENRHKFTCCSIRGKKYGFLSEKISYDAETSSSLSELSKYTDEGSLASHASLQKSASAENLGNYSFSTKMNSVGYSYTSEISHGSEPTIRDFELHEIENEEDELYNTSEKFDKQHSQNLYEDLYKTEFLSTMGSFSDTDVSSRDTKNLSSSFGSKISVLKDLHTFKEYAYDDPIAEFTDFTDDSIFDDLVRHNERSEEIDLFIKALAVCNTALPFSISQMKKDSVSNQHSFSSLKSVATSHRLSTLRSKGLSFGKKNIEDQQPIELEGLETCEIDYSNEDAIDLFNISKLPPLSAKIEPAVKVKKDDKANSLNEELSNSNAALEGILEKDTNPHLPDSNRGAHFHSSDVLLQENSRLIRDAVSFFSECPTSKDEEQNFQEENAKAKKPAFLFEKAATPSPLSIGPAESTMGREDFLRHETNGLLPFHSRKAFMRNITLSKLPQNSEYCIIYQSTSPDEQCFVYAASLLNYTLIQKNQNFIVLDVNGSIQTFEILGMNPYTSQKKCMSVIVRSEKESDRAILFMKGAESVMSKLIDFTKEDQTIRQSLFAHTHLFSLKGLRTQVFAYRFLSDDEVDQIKSISREERSTFSSSNENKENPFSEFERNLKYLGITAISDLIQEGVNETIELLTEGGIRVWIVTGDRLDYTETIGYSCGLLNERSILFNAVKEWKALPNFQKTALSLYSQFLAVKKIQAKENELCLLFDSNIFKAFLKTDSLQDSLLVMLCSCDSVIACDMKADYKAKLLHLLREKISPHLTTLAIGNGENDVAMLKEADIGVSINFGQSMYSAGASDISVDRFDSLQRLLFFHGRQLLRRNSIVILWSFYKSLVAVFPLFLYQFFLQWSGTNAYNPILFILFTFLWMLLPLLLFGYIDNDIPPEISLNAPIIYILGRRKYYFNKNLCFIWIGESIFHSLLMCILSYFFFIENPQLGSGKTLGFETFGALILLNVVVISLLRLLMEFHFGLYLLSLVILIFSLLILLGYAFVESAASLFFWIPLYFLILIVLLLVSFTLFISSIIKSKYFPNLLVALKKWIFKTLISPHPSKFPFAKKPKFIFLFLNYLKHFVNYFWCWRDQSLLTKALSNTKFLKHLRRTMNPLLNENLREMLPPAIPYVISSKKKEVKEARSSTHVLPVFTSSASIEILASYVRDSSFNLKEKEEIIDEKEIDIDPLETNHEPSTELKVSNLIEKFTLKFKDSQLESDYKVHFKESFLKQFISWYQIIPLLIAFYYLVYFFLEQSIESKWNTNYKFIAEFTVPTVILIFAFLATMVATFYKSIFVDNFNKFMGSLVILLLLQHIISYSLLHIEGIITGVLIPVFTFVILRVPFLQAVTLNTMHLIFFFLSFFTQLVFNFYTFFYVRFLIDPDLLSVNLIYYLPLFVAIDVFLAFVGYRLEYNQRKSFLLDYSVEESRRKQREILNTMLPAFVVDQIINSGLTSEGIAAELKAEDKGTVTVIFCDLYEFQDMVAAIKPTALVELLDSLFLCFDKCADHYGSSKIETVFETYLAATGLAFGKEKESSSPEIDATNALEYENFFNNMEKGKEKEKLGEKMRGSKKKKRKKKKKVKQRKEEMAISMLNVASHISYEVVTEGADLDSAPSFSSRGINRRESFKSYNSSDYLRNFNDKSKRIQLKIGIHSGRVISGVVGVKKPQYALFGIFISNFSIF